MQLTRLGLVTDQVDLGPNQSLLGLVVVMSGLIGALVVGKMPSNPVGWLLVALGFGGIATELAGEYAIYTLIREPGSLPLGAEAAWVFDWGWVVPVALIPPLLLYFPDGALLSPRWRVVLWADGAFVASVLAQAAYTWRERGVKFLSAADVPLANPTPFANFLSSTGPPILMIVLAACAWSVRRRYGRSGGVERHQLKWLVYASILFALAISLAWVVFRGESPVLNSLSYVAIGGLPASIGVAIFKYRLYDVDVVINKTLVYGALAAFITAIYVGIVVGIGSLLGVGDEPNLGLSILATALIAVAFQPFRQRVQRFANRLVYGKRSTPYEVLAEFSTKMAGSLAQDELLSQMAFTLAGATGGASAQVWVKVGNHLRLAASFHRGIVAPESDEEHHPPVPVSGTDFFLPDSDQVAPVIHKGELLGALAVTKRSGEQMTPVEGKLMGDLASQAGVVLRNVQLTEELLEKLEELKASRQRLVAAQDKARRRLERDLHDGAQQQLVALKVKLSLAQRLTTQEKVKQFLTQLQAEADDTLQTLRDLARGIYPPLLAEKGLPTALIAQANKSALEVEVKAEGVGRYSQELEAAVYFCCLEALQNIAKYAGPCRVVITLTADADTLSFEVADDGNGFEVSSSGPGHGIQNMSDRMDALGGALEVTSTPGAGTTVRGRVPARAVVPAT
jgi:signal transduction histidine kinase